MILIDALYVNYGGALGLLHYLTESLINRNIEFFLLADSRCGKSFDNIRHVEYLKASIRERMFFYRHHYDDFDSILCFGNVPPPIKMKVPVYTYFHNINLLTLQVKGNKRKLLNLLKREYIRLNRRHTSFWIVQTTNVADCMTKHLGTVRDSILILPFFQIPSFEKHNTFINEHEYIFVGEYTDEKGHIPLVKAWRLLHRMGYHYKLHLTFSSGPKEFISLFNETINEGVLIENHGFVSHDEVFRLLSTCRATIYPSYNESLGLGLIEAIEAGCDVIASDLPFTHAVCIPSETFDPYNPKSIVDAVLRYENGKSHRTHLIIKDSIQELINTIVRL